MTAGTPVSGSPATPKAFAVWFKDLERWSVGSFIALGWRWPRDLIRPLFTALHRKSIDVDRKATDVDALQLVTLHFDGEMEHRQQRGTKPIKGRLWWADPGDMVYSKIDVRNGAIGIVPDDLGRVCVTSEYPVYAVDRTIADARYIKLLFRTSAFRRKINGMISGASGRKRVQPADLEAVDVPLPPLPVQRVIVTAWEQAQTEIADTRRRIAELEDKIEADFLADLGLTKPQRATPPKIFAAWWKDIDRWGVRPNQLAAVAIDIQQGKYPVASGREFLSEIKHGCSASPSPKPTGLEVLKISAVTRGQLDIGERKFMHDRTRYRREFDLKSGDVLSCRTNGTLGLVGMSALVEQDIEDIIFPDKVIRIRGKSNILPAYLWKALQMPFARSQIEAVARTAVGNFAIGTDDLWKLELPLPPLPVQRQLVAKVTAQRKRIAALRAEADGKTQQAKSDVEAIILGEKAVTVEQQVVEKVGLGVSIG